MKRLSILFSLLFIISSFAMTAPAFAKSSIDIVFIIDRSGSMTSSINAVKNNVKHFSDLLVARGISYRLGLVTYAASVTRYDLTSDVDKFKNQVGRISVEGETENGLDAIMEAGQNYPFDLNATKYFILIGDENVVSQKRYTNTSVIQYLRSTSTTLTTIGIEDNKTQFQHLANGTGGMYLDLNSDFGTTLTSIFEQIQQIPTLEIIAPTSGQMLSDLNAFIPTVKVTDPDSSTLQLSEYIDSETTPRETKTVTNSTIAQTVSFNALNLESLAEGGHTLRFTVNDGTNTVQDTVAITIDKASPTIGSMNVTATATSIQVTASAADSVSGLHASPYRFTVGSNVSSWITNSTYAQTGLTPNTAYRVLFEARDAVGHIGQMTKNVQTKAELPVLAKGQISENAADIMLQDANPSATEYQVKVGTQYIGNTGSLTATPTWITPANKKLTITGLIPNSDYTVQAKARNQSGEETAFSTAISLKTLVNSPANLVSKAEQRSIQISWTPIPGISQYEVEADSSVISIGAATSYTHNALSPNTQHSYRVRAFNATGAGNWSQPLIVFTLADPPGIPANIQAIPKQNDITITWDAVAKAEFYDIEADGSVMEAGNQLKYVLNGLQPESEHKIRIRAKNSGGIGEWSAPIFIRTLPVPPSTPIGLEANPTNNQVTLQWRPSQGATGYEVESDGLILDNGQLTQYVHQGLYPLTGHTYRVRAVNSGGKSPWTAPIEVTTLPDKPKKPSNVMTTADPNSITLMWYQVAHTDEYEIEVDGSQIVKVKENQYVHSGIAPDSVHSYRVRAHNVSGYSDWTRPATMSTFPAGDNNDSLTNMVAVVTNRAITITWDTVAQNAQYEIEVDGRMSDIGSNTVYHHGGLQAEEFHTYKIRLKQEDKPGRWVAILSLSTLPDPPDAPASLNGFAANTSIELRWDRIAGATGYDLEIDGETINAGAMDSYIHKDLSPGTSHTYRLRAKNETGVTAWSPALISSTTSPTYLINAQQGRSFDLSLLAFNVQDFSEMTYVVKYDPTQVEVLDLYQFTPKADLMASGEIPGSNLEVTYSSGKITYKIKRNIVPGTSWSGELATITFKSKINGQAAIDALVE